VYTQNVFDESEASQQQDDLRAVAAAGIDAYVGLGENTVFAAFARPSYNWWLDNAELRRLNMSYGAAVFGLFNRLTTELSVKRKESQRLLNNELRVPATLRQDSLSLEGRLGIRGPWQVFGAATVSESRYPNAEALEGRAPELQLLARDEEVLSAGLAYDIADRFNLGLGWRRVESTFVDDPLLRSNRGQGPFLAATISGNKIEIDADLGVRRLEFVRSSTLEETDETVGTLRTSFDVGARTKLTAFGARDIVYSALDAGSFFSSARTGVAASWGDETSLVVVLFAETGRDRFESAGDQNPGRTDDNESYGLRLRIPLRWGLRLDLGASEVRIDSNLDMFDRSLTSVTSSVSLAVPEFPF
jgi:hypothetical protein